MALEDILGINARNFSYIRAYNSREVVRLVDNKLKTKRVLRNAGLPVPDTYKVFRRPEQVRKFDFKSLPNSFVVKPNSGFGGKGILVVYGRSKKGFLRSDGGLLTEDKLKLHILNILEGTYSLSGLPDVAYIEERIKPDRSLKKWAYRGLPDIRVIVFRLVPVMAMLRLPTKESRGRANLHEGAIGIGIDLATGLTTDGYRAGKRYKVLPHSKIKIKSKKIKFWQEILLLASEAQAAAGGDYLGVDIALTEKGPMILELNARPGLSIQNVNQAGLRERLMRLKKVEVENAQKGVSLGKELFRMRKEDVGEERPVVGLVEVVEFFGKKKRVKTLAKIDTGAYSCSLDFSVAKQLGLEELVEKAKALHRAFRKKDESEIKRLQKDISKFSEFVRFKKVRSSLGREVRPLIKLKFKLAGRVVTTEAHLANRRHLRYPVILGRKSVSSFYIVDPLKYVSRLHPFKAKSLDEVRAFFALCPRYIVGIGVNAVRRAGPEKFISRYCVASLRKNSEDSLLKKQGLEIFSVFNKTGDEKILKANWNSLAVVSSPQFKNFLESINFPTAWLVHTPSEKIRKIAKRYKAKVLATKPELFQKIDNRLFIRRLATKWQIPVPKWQLIDLQKKEKKVKLRFPLVVQTLHSVGGRDTERILNKKSWPEKIKSFKEKLLLVSEEIKGVPLSVEACVLRKGVFYLSPQIQIVDQKELAGEGSFGRFCGYDFTSSLIPVKIQQQCFEIVEKISDYLREKGYKGVFGLDCIWGEDGKVYLIEMNPRLVGTLPTRVWFQLSQKQIPFLAWHLMEFLGASYSVDYKRMQKKYLEPQKGAQLVLYYLGEKPAIVRKGLKAGTYFFDGQKLVYRRAEHSFSKLAQNEFILTDGAPSRGTVLKPGFTLCQVVTKNSVVDKTLKRLNPWAYRLVKVLKTKIKI